MSVIGKNTIFQNLKQFAMDFVAAMLIFNFNIGFTPYPWSMYVSVIYISVGDMCKIRRQQAVGKSEKKTCAKIEK